MATTTGKALYQSRGRLAKAAAAEAGAESRDWAHSKDGVGRDRRAAGGQGR